MCDIGNEIRRVEAVPRETPIRQAPVQEPELTPAAAPALEPVPAA